MKKAWKRSRPSPAERAAAAEEARKAIRPAFAKVRDRNDTSDPATQAWKGAVAAFWRALDAAYPPGFWDDCARLRRGDWTGLETAIGFLEDNQFFFRSGYVKARLITLVKRAPLSASQIARLQDVVAAAVDGRDRREFRRYCRLAAQIDGPRLRQAIEARTASGDSGVRRRARWVLDALDHGARTKAGLGATSGERSR